MDVIIGTIGYDAELEQVRGYLEKILLEPGAFKQMRYVLLVNLHAFAQRCFLRLTGNF